jgi:hypothetical protein
MPLSNSVFEQIICIRGYGQGLTVYYYCIKFVAVAVGALNMGIASRGEVKTYALQ